MKWYFHIFCLIASLVAGVVRAEEVEFPDEELARESVLPIFENPQDVLHRHVNTDKKFEIGLGGGLEIDEPFYNDIIYTLHAGYHFTNLSAFNLDGLIWSPGLSSYGVQLRGNSSINNWDASLAPHPLWGVIGNYEFTAYYGKISITKETVMNLNLFFFGGPLYINMQNYNSFGGDIGLGQNFFMSQWISLRFDFRMLIFQGPNAAAQNLSLPATKGVSPSVSNYQTRVFFNNQVDLMLVFLL